MQVVLEMEDVDGESVVVQAPPNAFVAPPGLYMLFLLSQGVPSVAVWVRLSPVVCAMPLSWSAQTFTYIVTSTLLHMPLACRCSAAKGCTAAYSRASEDPRCHGSPAMTGTLAYQHVALCHLHQSTKPSDRTESCPLYSQSQRAQHGPNPSAQAAHDPQTSEYRQPHHMPDSVGEQVGLGGSVPQQTVEPIQMAAPTQTAAPLTDGVYTITSYPRSQTPGCRYAQLAAGCCASVLCCSASGGVWHGVRLQHGHAG